jgi:hypothetical protein
MHASWIAAFFAALQLAPTPANDGAALDAVLACQERSVGDMATLHSLVLDFRMEEPEQSFDLRMRMLRPDRLRVDMLKLGASVYSEGLGERGPWQQNLLQWSPRRTSKAGGEAIVNGVEGSAWGRSLREMRQRGHAVTLGDTTRPGEIGVRVVFRNGTRRDYFLDAGTCRIRRSRQVFALHPDFEGVAAKPQSIVTTYQDHRRVAGFVFPMRIVNRDEESGAIVQTIFVREILVNEALEPDLFESR